MDEPNHYFRISVSPRSCIRLMVLTFVFTLYAIALWAWPYYLPLWFKLSCIACLALTLVYLHAETGSQDAEVYYLGANGRFQSAGSSNIIEAEISPSSYVLPWCVQLHLTSELGQPASWLTLYNDQIDNAAIRRLRRMIFRAKQLA